MSVVDPLWGRIVQALLGVLICFVYGISAWGWGRLLAKRWGLLDLPAPWLAAFGLAVMIALGGVINLLGGAFPWVLNLVFVAGVSIALFYIWHASACLCPRFCRRIARYRWHVPFLRIGIATNR